MNEYDSWAEIMKALGHKITLRPDEIIVDTKYAVISLVFFEDHLIGAKTILLKG